MCNLWAQSRAKTRAAWLRLRTTFFPNHLIPQLAFRCVFCFCFGMTERAYRGDNTTGFQSPAQDHVEGVPDLADLLELRRPQRYAVRVKGDGLKVRGIHGGDILVVNTEAEPRSGKVCVAFLFGDVCLAILSERDGEWWLEPSGQPAALVADDVEVWALVAALVRTDV